MDQEIGVALVFDKEEDGEDEVSRWFFFSHRCVSLFVGCI